MLAAYSVAALGIGLISVSGLYIYSQSRSGSDIAEFVYSVPDESLDTHLGIEAKAPQRQPIADDDQPIPFELKSPDVAQFASLYPGDLLNPKYWSEPEWGGIDPFGGPSIPDNFVPLLSTDIFRDFDPTSNATHIRIPAINVNSTVSELKIIDLGDQRSY